MKYTIKDIAREAGVSITAVSLVMNQKPHRISAEKVQLIHEVINRLNYKPNVVAQSMITQRTRTIGLIVPDITNPYFAELAKQIELRLSEHQYNLFLCNSLHEYDREENYIRVLKDRNVDGMLISSAHSLTKIQYESIRSLGIPIVFLDRSYTLQSTNCIAVDDEKGGYCATQHLIDAGHKKIACVTDHSAFLNVQRRYEGYRLALEKSGGSTDDSLIFETELSVEGGMRVAEQLLEDRTITAVFCSNDLTALGIYEVYQSKGLNIPEDLSVVGFDNIPIAAYMYPKLTTIAQPIQKIGQIAADNMIQLVTGKKKYFKNVMLDVALVERQSVKSRKEYYNEND
ncbi:MAG: LacI family DNA-binding transcriptional regulator [Bacilli bacterium]